MVSYRRAEKLDDEDLVHLVQAKCGGLPLNSKHDIQGLNVLIVITQLYTADETFAQKSLAMSQSL